MLDLSTLWDVPPGTMPQPMEHTGYNNELYRVDAGDRQLVLRVYGNHANSKYIQHELSIVYQLQACGLPFQVPAPVLTHRNEMWTVWSDGRAKKLMVLLPFIRGHNPSATDLVQAEASGEALGMLLVAMAAITSNMHGLTGTQPVVEINRVHPLVPDAFEAMNTLGTLVPKPVKARVNAILEHVYDDTRRMSKTLPHQLTHGDFINGNLLVEGAQVTGVLDFENSAINPRVMDLAIAIDTWSWDAQGTGNEWPRIDALARGYARVSKLSTGEIDAIPSLILLRNASVLMHLVGRFLSNTTPYVDVDQWIEAMLHVDAWLTLNGEKLKECVWKA